MPLGDASSEAMQTVGGLTSPLSARELADGRDGLELHP
jgi:hypothetical protein